MKSSKYNMFLTMSDKTRIAFNSMTCALAEIDDDFIEIINNAEDLVYSSLDNEKKELVDNMLEANYLIEEKTDELKLLQYRHLSGKYNNEGLILTIAPTLDCNFQCPYCYEVPRKGLIKQDVIDGIIRIVNEAAEKRKQIFITWYGGEPLIAKDIIFNLSNTLINICHQNKVKYSSDIITNGYLIDNEIISGFKKACISSAQITLDGPPEIHNKRRKLRGANKDTFKVILENVKKLHKNGIKVIIRVNLDKTNTDSLENLLNILKENDLSDIQINLGHVNTYTEACMSIADTCFNTEEYAKECVAQQEILWNKSFNSIDNPYFPRAKANYCCADSISSFVIDPEGFLYKCWNDIGNKNNAVGNVRNANELQNEEALSIDYLLWTPFSYQNCIDCILLPICMGGCPHSGLKMKSKPECEKWKYNLEDIIKLTYLHSKNISNT